MHSPVKYKCISNKRPTNIQSVLMMDRKLLASFSQTCILFVISEIRKKLGDLRFPYSLGQLPTHMEDNAN